MLHAAGDVLLGLVDQRSRALALVVEVAQKVRHFVAADRAQRLFDELI